MAPRRVPAPSVSPHQYYAVPTNAPPSSGGRYSNSGHPQGPRTSRQQIPASGSNSQRAHSNGSRSSSRASHRGANDVYRGVAAGQIGNGYGPYSFEHHGGAVNPPFQSQYSVAPSQNSAPEKPPMQRVNTSTVPAYMWDTKDPDLDDPLHNPGPYDRDGSTWDFDPFSLRGWINASAIFIICAGLIILFAGYPIINWAMTHPSRTPGFNLGGINASGQIPSLPGMPSLIDKDTPDSAMTRTGTDGKKYNLVFSDEFELEGRTFYPGDDPYWEAADLNYWPTADIEWYDPVAVTTTGGNMVITMDEVKNHNLNFRSGMVTSWNKFCFTTGYIEVKVSMPGSPQAPGLWPAAWTMGNLGRAGYGATTEGMWPYSYDACDLGTFPNQTAKNGTPAAASTGGADGGPISFLPGQRLSACTCPDSDHPGPSYSKGRGVPEIDIFETQVDVSLFRGEVSQSVQAAPYNYQYEFANDSSTTPLYDESISHFNTYKGGVFQQAISAVTQIDSANYGGNGFATYGFEWWSDSNSRDDGYITWFSQGDKSWTATAGTLGPDSVTQVSQRLVSEEPMYIIFNLGMSPGFQQQDFKHLQFPSKMYIDYVRVYQRDGVNAVGCSPKSHPTADYITKHSNAYTDANLTTWNGAGYTFPRNSLYDGCF